MTRTWPEDWDSRKRGIGCWFCTDLTGRSFRSGRVSEALLERNAIATGHVAVVFRPRHVAAFTDLAPGELADYWADIQDVGRAVERVFQPCHVNYLLLGNIVPHLHVHVVPRYLDDSAPERPLPWNAAPVPEELFAERFRLLRDASDSGIGYELSRTFAASPESLFAALTNAAVLKRIWGVQEITVDARVGGQAVAIFVVDGNDWSFTITYTELAPADGRLRWVARFKRFPSKETRVTVILDRTTNGTVLTLRMGNFESADERDANRQAWDRGLAILAEVVAESAR